MVCPAHCGGLPAGHQCVWAPWHRAWRHVCSHDVSLRRLSFINRWRPLMCIVGSYFSRTHTLHACARWYNTHEPVQTRTRPHTDPSRTRVSHPPLPNPCIVHDSDVSLLHTSQNLPAYFSDESLGYLLYLVRNEGALAFERVLTARMEVSLTLQPAEKPSIQCVHIQCGVMGVWQRHQPDFCHTAAQACDTAFFCIFCRL